MSTMTTAGPPDRPRRERALSGLGTKSPDNAWSSRATGGQADDSVESGDAEHAGATIETDGGRVVRDEDKTSFRTYTDRGYDYSVAYPADWAVEPELGGGVTFESPRSAAGAAVFVEENGLTPAESATAFLAELDADEHVHGRELLAQRDVHLTSGQNGRAVKCAYVGGSHERWQLLYLFVRVVETSYTVGIDWHDATGFDATATTMVESFALGAC